MSRAQAHDHAPDCPDCETDVLNTYGVYLHWLVNSGALTPEQLDGELDLMAEALDASDAPHLREFLTEWRGA